MTRIFLIRHAESIANTLGVFQGQTYDTPLSSLGIRQQVSLQKRFSKTKFDRIFVSPLIRTRQTALGLKGKNVITKEILETNHGQWEGKTKGEIQEIWPKLYEQWIKNPENVLFPKGELFKQTFTRAVNWFNTIIHSEQTIAVVTHSNIIMCLLAYLEGKTANDIWSYAMQPTAVSLIEVASPAKIIYKNDISHLQNLTSDLSTQAL